MTDQNDAAGDFRTRSRAVRQAAQERLAKLRAERRAAAAQSGPRWRPSRAGTPAEAHAEAPVAPAEAAPAAPAPAPAPAPSKPDVAAAAAKTSPAKPRKSRAPKTAKRAPSPASETSSLEASPRAEALAAAARAERDAATVIETTPESERPAPETPSAAAAPTAPAARPERASPSATAKPDAPETLSELPGVGPGLIWLLERAEVRTLSDLAAADAERLSAELGVIGRLVDVGAWIELARARSGADHDAP